LIEHEKTWNFLPLVFSFYSRQIRDSRHELARMWENEPYRSIDIFIGKPVRGFETFSENILTYAALKELGLLKPKCKIICPTLKCFMCLFNDITPLPFDVPWNIYVTEIKDDVYDLRDDSDDENENESPEESYNWPFTLRGLESHDKFTPVKILMERFGETIEERNNILYMDRFDLPHFGLYKKDRFQRILEDRDFVKKLLPELMEELESYLNEPPLPDPPRKYHERRQRRDATSEGEVPLIPLPRATPLTSNHTSSPHNLFRSRERVSLSRSQEPASLFHSPEQIVLFHNINPRKPPRKRKHIHYYVRKHLYIRANNEPQRIADEEVQTHHYEGEQMLQKSQVVVQVRFEVVAEAVVRNKPKITQMISIGAMKMKMMTSTMSRILAIRAMRPDRQRTARASTKSNISNFTATLTQTPTRLFMKTVGV